MAPAPTVCVSALLSLEPLIGIAVAVNLGFLSLPRFAYVIVVKERIIARLRKLDRRALDTQSKLEPFQQLRALTEVDGHPSINFDLKRKWWVPTPRGWGWAYNILFHHSLAQVGGIIATLFSLCLIVLAIGHDNDILGFARCGVTKADIGTEFWLAVGAIAWPLICVAMGEWVIRGAIRLLKQQTHHLELAQKTQNNQTLSEFECWLQDTVGMNVTAVQAPAHSRSALPPPPPPPPPPVRRMAKVRQFFGRN